MKNTDQPDKKNRISVPYATSADLRGRQSVRATFRLTEKAIEAISIVSVHLGIKQKSLFDHLIEDTQTLGAIAKEAGSIEFKRRERVQKTFVLSRKTLSLLESIAHDFNTPRDALVEYSILRLLPVIRQEQEKHKKRKAMLEAVEKHLDQSLKLVETAGKILGEDDPVFIKLAAAVGVWENSYHEIASFIERCKIIEDFKPDVLEAVLKRSRE